MGLSVWVRKHTHAWSSTYLLVVIIGLVHTLRHKVGNQLVRFFASDHVG